MMRNRACRVFWSSVRSSSSSRVRPEFVEEAAGLGGDDDRATDWQAGPERLAEIVDGVVGRVEDQDGLELRDHARQCSGMW